MKNRARTISTNAVKVVTGTLHAGVTVTTSLTVATLDFVTNTVEAVGMGTADKIAQVEGYALEKINGTPRAEGKQQRISYTQSRMKSAAAIAEMGVMFAKAKLEEGNEAVKDAASKIKAQVVKPMSLEDQISAIQAERDEYLSSTNDADTVVSSKCMVWNNKIGKLRKAMTKQELPLITPEVAFAN